MMTWKTSILQKAEKDLEWFRQYNRSCYVKCFDLVRELVKDPRKGTGKPERLKYFDREVWSHRVHMNIDLFTLSIQKKG